MIYVWYRGKNGQPVLINEGIVRSVGLVRDAGAPEMLYEEEFSSRGGERFAHLAAAVAACNPATDHVVLLCGLHPHDQKPVWVPVEYGPNLPTDRHATVLLAPASARVPS